MPVKLFIQFLCCLCVFIFYIPSFFGFDSDLQAYALHAKMLYQGYIPYVDFFTHKPPVYPILLLPGNFIGGSYLSFFFIHLCWVIVAHAMIFELAYQLSKSIFAASLACFIYLSFTIFVYENYWTGNASILYPVIASTCLGIIILQKNLESKNSLSLLQGGVLGLAIAFCVLTRFSPSLGIMCIVTYIWQKTKQQPQNLLPMFGLVFYFALPLTVFIYWGWNFRDEIYSQLILFNKSYVSLNKLNFYDKLKAYYKVFHTVIRYNWFLLFLSFICFAINIFKNNKKLKGLLLFTTIWAIVEGFLIILQNKPDSPYYNFTLYAPICIICAITLSVFLHKKKYLYLASGLLSLFYISHSIQTIVKIKENLEVLESGEELKLMKQIQELATTSNSLFTFDFMAYMYLNSGQLPRKKIPANYDHSHWTFNGTDTELSRKYWHAIKDHPPQLVLRKSENKNLDDAMIDFFSQYSVVGKYNVRYAGNIELLKRI